MKTVTVHALDIQLDVDVDKNDDTAAVLKAIAEALEIINVHLRREPYDMNAQIVIPSTNSLTYDVEDCVYDEDEDEEEEEQD